MPVDGLWKGNALLRSLLQGWRGPFSLTPLEGSLLCSEARRRVLDAGLSSLFVNYFATSQLFLLRVCGLKWLSRPSAQCCDSTVYLRKAGHYRHRGKRVSVQCSSARHAAVDSCILSMSIVILITAAGNFCGNLHLTSVHSHARLVNGLFMSNLQECYALQFHYTFK